MIKETYIAVSKETAEKMHVTRYRQQNADGEYILNSFDFSAYGTNDQTLEDKVKEVGGRILNL